MQVGDVTTMTGVETRSVSRDSLFLLANVRVEQRGEQYRVRVRNLSDGGMMGEGTIKINRGNRVEVELRNVGSVMGTVAWVQDQRFGVAFDEEIDSQHARAPANSVADQLPPTTHVSHAHRPPAPPPPTDLRKI
ncbi:MAG: PilZ domain-containing protein [Pseudomonadota bacterium]